MDTEGCLEEVFPGPSNSSKISESVPAQPQLKDKEFVANWTSNQTKVLLDLYKIYRSKKKTYPLHKVIKYRNIHKMKILLPVTKDINEKNEMGYTPLLYACEQENNDEMLELLFAEKNIDPFAVNNEGQTVLHILAFKGSLYWIKQFFKRFSDVPVDLECNQKNTPLIMAAKMDHDDIIKFFYNKGANINHRNEKYFTALLYTANNGYTKSTNCLLELGAEIDARDDYGCTPLIKACSWTFLEVCEILIEKGANINAVNGLGFSPLISSVKRQHVKITEFLLRNGADLNVIIKTEHGSYTPLVSACLSKNVTILRLLIKYGGDVNFPGDYSQALFNCIKTDFYDGVVELIKAGVDLRGRHAVNKKTPLENARKFKRAEIARLIDSRLNNH